MYKYGNSGGKTELKGHTVPVQETDGDGLSLNRRGFNIPDLKYNYYEIKNCTVTEKGRIKCYSGLKTLNA